MNVYSEVDTYSEVSGEEINDSFKTYGAALEMMTRENVILMQQIFQDGCKKVQCLALKAAFEAEMLQNQALKKHLQPGKTIVNEEDLKEATEQAKKLEWHIAGSRIQNSNLQQLRQDQAPELTDALEDRCAQLKDHNEEDNDALQERFIELSRENRKLIQEIESLKVQKSQLEEECEQLTSKRTQEESLLTVQCALLKAKVDRICWENGEMHEGLTELRERLTNQEMLREQCREQEEEIEKLIAQNGDLQQVFKSVNSKLSPDVKQRYLQLKTETDIKHENAQRLVDDIYSMVKNLAQETCWKEKSEAMELSRYNLEREHEVLEQRLKKVTQMFEDQKNQENKFKYKVEKLELLKAATNMKQQEVDKMQKKVLNLKAMSESYKHIDYDEADIQAVNEMLEKKKQKLERQLQTLKQTEAEFQKVTSDSKKLRKENCSLYKQLVTLKNQIAQQALLKVHLKTRQSEKKILVQRQKQLQKKIFRCDDKRERAHGYEVKSKECEDQITKLERRTDELQSLYEELLVAKFTQEMWAHISSHRMKEMQQMEKVNCNMEFIISEQKKEL